ncbi:3-oxoacyl-ACP reductase [Rhizobium sp. Root1203]|uniref:SDR family NAD(P)-dependent oxidoreductase n=1 Tax=Rhizobium sp. Root1203 TaxID=1736427 RepID=UPI00070A0ACB|nr:SDR family NAD(P)-dependent oxidoreductase [Rhizobium sp. Root1203]KQV17315.1 3-oxoacyl-ACP reductase [Rhizobium sp. Root1203]
MDKLAIVTGGSTGIGAHVVEAFSLAGFKVAFSFLSSREAADALVSGLTTRSGYVAGFECDVGFSGEVSLFYDEAVKWAGTEPHVLVNNAAVQTWSPLLDLEEDSWDKVIRTNLKGTFLNTKEAARRMIAAGIKGSIVNIGSGCNKLGFPNLVDYTASKGGIEQFTKVAAIELGPHGIRVNCIAPGSVATERTNRESPDYGATWSKITPLRRVGTPEDIAGPVLFLTTEQSSFITGQTIWVDGGLFSQPNWPY